MINNKPFTVSKNDPESVAKGNSYSITQLWNQFNKIKKDLVNVKEFFDFKEQLSDLLDKNKKKLYLSKNEDYKVDSVVDVVLVDCTTSNITITLPKTQYNEGKNISIKKLDSSSNNVIVNSSDNVEGSSSYSFNTQYESYTFMATQLGWLIIN